MAGDLTLSTPLTAVHAASSLLSLVVALGLSETVRPALQPGEVSWRGWRLGEGLGRGSETPAVHVAE